MLRKLRRSIASFAVVAIIASLSVASAVSAFSDVTESDWYYTNVQDLVDAGVIDGTKDKFNGGANLNRAEAAKIAVMAAGVAEEDLVNPATPSFSDVPKSLWAYKYIETAKSLGYVSGDAGKNTFRPGANVNRAEYAKMMGLALELEENTAGGPHFSDVASGAWYYNHVETAYNWSVVNGYEGGLFKPAAAINRAEMSKMTVAAMDPTERVATTPAPGVDCTKTPTAAGCVVAPVAGADMSVSLASDTPAGTTHASGTSYNNVLKLNVTASANSDSKLSKITLTRGGISIDSNIAGVAVFDSTGKRHGNFLTFSENKAVVDFSSDPIVVAKGTTASVSIKTNLNTGALSGTYQISVLKAEDLDAAGGKVTGSFPITGSTFQLANGATTVGTLTVDAVLVHNNGANDVTAVNINLGTKDQDIAKFRFAAGANEDVKISKLSLYNNGNSSDGDVQNIRLVAADGTILSTVAQTKNRDLTFDLSASPYLITKGNSRDLIVRLDIVSGSTRTARFVIQNDYDVEIVGGSTLSGLLATAAAGVDTAFPIGDSIGASCSGAIVCLNKITVNSGTLLFAKSNDAPTGNIAAGGTNLTIGKWDVTAQGEDMELRTVSAVLTYGTVPTGSFKIKVGDATVYSSSTFTTSPMTQAVTLSSYPVLKSGVKTTISYVIDVGSSTASGQTFGVSMDLTQVKRLSTNDLVDPGVNATAANTLSVATASLSSSKNSSFNDTTVVAGLSDAKIGSFNLNASSTEDVTVSSITVALTNTTAVSNLKLMSGATQLGTSATTPSASNVFSISGFKILKGATATVDVYLTSTSSATGTEVSSITAIGASGAASSVTITATGLTTTGSTITFSAAGTLTVTLDTTNTPVAKIVHSGMVDEAFTAVRLTSNNAEDVKISTIQVVGTNSENSFKDLKLFVGATQYGTTTQLVKGVASFSGLNLVIPKDSTVTLLVKGSTTTSGVMNSTAAASFSLGYIEATGVSGGATIKPGTTVSTAWTATSTSQTAANISVTSTSGFHAGDVIFVHSDDASGGDIGMVTAEPTTSTLLNVATRTALTLGANPLVGKISTGATVTGTGTPVKAGATFTVTSGASTKGFAVGDAVLYQGATLPALGYVSAVSSSTLTINSIIADGSAGAATRVSKVGTDTLSTGITAVTALTAATATATTVTSTSGFSVGDVVLVQDTTATGSIGVVTAVGSTTGITLGLRTNVTPTSITSATLVRIGAVSPSTSLVTTVGTTGNAELASTAHAVTSTAGFGVGDTVMSYGTAGTGLAIFGVVSELTSAVSMKVQSAEASASVATRWTRLPGAASASNRVLVQDSELTVSANPSFVGGSTAGGSGQSVGMFDLKADGDRNMTVSNVRVKMGGSNLPFAYVHNFDLYNGGSLLASGTNTIGSTVADNGTNAATAGATQVKLCAAADGAGAANEWVMTGNSGADLTAAVAKLKAGDTFVLFGTSALYATYTLTADAAIAVGGDRCTGSANAADVLLTVSNGTLVGGPIADNDAPTLYSYTVTFGSNSSASSPVLPAQVITGGSVLTLTVKADTTGVKTGITSGTTNFNVKLDGVAGPATANTNSVTWTYTPSNGSAISNTAVSDSYPVAAPTLVF